MSRFFRSWRLRRLGAQPTGNVLKRRIGVEGLFVACLALVGAFAGAASISDNSMLLHIRTGIDMFHSWSIPRHDPYTFTAQGKPWVVQSWLAEWSYGALDQLWGSRGIVVLITAMTAGVSLCMALLARTGSALRTALAGAVAVMLGIQGWGQRPLLFGLLGFALTVLIVERKRSKWWLIPLVWIWVNSHSSYWVAVVWFGALIVGDFVDTRRVDRDLLGYFGTFVLGVVIGGVVNPLGYHLLAFVLTVGEHRDSFSAILEWMSPDFRSLPGVPTLIGLLSILVIFAMTKPRWREVLPFTALIAMSLTSQRNLPLAAIASAPILGRILAQASEKKASRSEAPFFFVFPIAALALFAALRALTVSSYDFIAYPQDAYRWLGDRGYLTARHHIAVQDWVGDWQSFKRFPNGTKTFIDDRVDMFPNATFDDFRTLNDLGPGTSDVLDRWSIDAVVWEEKDALPTYLSANSEWQEGFSDDKWIVYTRARS